MITLTTEQISNLIREGDNIIKNKMNDITRDPKTYTISHQVVHYNLMCIIRDKVRFLLAEDADNLYVDIWYNTEYFKTCKGSKVFIPTFSVEVRFYTEEMLTKWKNHIQLNEFRCAEKYSTVDIDLAATIVRRRASLYHDGEGHLLLEWNITLSDDCSYKLEECPYIDPVDAKRLQYGLDKDEVLERWIFDQLRDIITNATDRGYPLSKQRKLSKVGNYHIMDDCKKKENCHGNV